jgi:hypothetical protein
VSFWSPWLAALPLAPVERILFSLGAAIISTPLLIGLPKIGLPVGQRMENLNHGLDDAALV